MYDDKFDIIVCFVCFVFICLPHDYNNNYKKMPKKKCRKKMARRPKGNYRAYVN